MNTHERLIEWVDHYPVVVNYGSPESLTYRIMREGLVGAAINGGVKSDGGMFKALKRYRNTIATDIRTRQVQRAVSKMPDAYRTVIDAEYVGRLTPDRAASRLRMDERKYYQLRGMALEWVRERLDPDSPIVEAA